MLGLAQRLPDDACASLRTEFIDCATTAVVELSPMDGGVDATVHV